MQQSDIRQVYEDYGWMILIPLGAKGKPQRRELANADGREDPWEGDTTRDD